MSSSSPRISVAVSAPAVGDGMPPEDLGSEEFDGLLQPSVWDTLVDLGDFPCADLSGSNGTETQHYKQQQPLLSPPKTSGRKRSLPQTCSWDNLGPKALSEISASLLAGGWDGSGNSSMSISSPQFLGPPAAAAAAAAGPSANSAAAPPTASPCSSDAAAPSQALVTAKQERLGGTAAAAGGKGSSSSKGRRGAAAGGVKAGGGAGGGGGKRPLNPDRMERKASREKRRREEVNEKFDQLLQVLEEAEATSGLEPPAAKEGKAAAHACINGRRVEVLSRTIQVLKKLLEERREALASVPPAAADTFTAVAGGSNGWQEEEETAEGPVLDGGFRSEVEESNPSPLATETAAAAAAAAAATRDAIDSNEAAAEGVGAQAEAAVAALSATVAASPEGAAANPQTLMHHVAMPVSGHHASMIMAPGFTGVPGHHVPTPSHGIPGHPGGPIFFAVPMYMPQGQGIPAAAATASTAAVENAAQAPAATAVAAPSLAATLAAAADLAPTPVAEAAAAPGVVDAMEPVPAPSGKKTWAVPAGYQSMMTLQMPQFVTQALSAEEGNEKPTHAVCA